jgi:hypothetical protein
MVQSELHNTIVLVLLLISGASHALLRGTNIHLIVLELADHLKDTGNYNLGTMVDTTTLEAQSKNE